MIEKAAGLDSTTSLIALLQNAKKHATKVINVAEELAQIQHAHGGDVKTALMQLSNRMKRGIGDDAAIVVDLGSGTLRAGFAGDEKPTASFANMVGHPKYDEVIVGVENKDHYVGDEADAMRGVLVLKYPIKHGIVEDYELLDLIWAHTFDNELRVKPQGKKIMITEPPLNPLHVREKLATDLFGKYGVAGMYINNAAVLSIYAAGRSTGLAVSSGDGVTHVVPVYEGYGLTHHIRRLDLGGAQINDWLKKLLAERGEFRGEDAETSAGREILRKIKETHCYVAFNEAMKDKPEYKDFDEEMKKTEEIVSYELPDKTVISLGKERFRCAEPLFNPMLIGRETSSVPKLIVESIEDCTMDVRDDLYNNICLSGGNSMFPGFAERLKKEVEKLRPAKKAVTIAAQPDRHIHTWIGGSILAGLSTFNDPEYPMWFMKTEYDVEGIEMLEQKCPWQR
jgi:actin-related protein